MKIKEESEKIRLKLNIQKMKIVASDPLTSWQTEEEKVEVVTDFTFLGSIITVNSDCSREIKTLAPWKKESDKKPRQCIKNTEISLCRQRFVVKKLWVFAVVKNLPVNAGDAGDVALIPRLGRSPGVGNSNLLQYP